MVHGNGPDAQAALCALTAPRLQHQLRRAEVICPNRETVPPMPLSALASLHPWGLVLWAVPVPDQFGASRVSTWPQRLVWHGLSPPDKQNAGADALHGRVIGTG